MEAIELLIGNCESGAFAGFKARLSGEKVASYQVEEGLVYTL